MKPNLIFAAALAAFCLSASAGEKLFVNTLELEASCFRVGGVFTKTEAQHGGRVEVACHRGDKPLAHAIITSTQHGGIRFEGEGEDKDASLVDAARQFTGACAGEGGVLTFTDAATERLVNLDCHLDFGRRWSMSAQKDGDRVSLSIAAVPIITQSNGHE
ncbi:MAG: hypothetical protein Q8Q28_03395 [Pseudomonadota bacterium]|nr:hypothetical protein [Pseudomonadota bacterium]